MKYQEKKVGSIQEVLGHVQEALTKLSKGELKVQEQSACLPVDKDLVYKVKYEDDELEGTLSIKVTWTNMEEKEEESKEE